LKGLFEFLNFSAVCFHTFNRLHFPYLFCFTVLFHWFVLLVCFAGLYYWFVLPVCFTVLFHWFVLLVCFAGLFRFTGVFQQLALLSISSSF